MSLAISDGRLLWIAVWLTTGLSAPCLAQSSAKSDTTTPAEWIQARGGTDNAGSIPGALHVEWQFRASHPVRAISVAAGAVLLGTESEDARGAATGPDQRGTVIALDAATGRRRWIDTFPSWIHGDAAIFHGRAYVTYGRWPMTSAGGIACVDLVSGKLLWTRAFPSGVMPAPAIDSLEDLVIVAGGDGVLSLLSLDNGKLQAELGLKASNAMSSPRIDPLGMVTFGAGSIVSSILPASHSFAWKVRFPRLHSIGDIPVALTDNLVLTTGTQNYGFWNAYRALPVSRFSGLMGEGLRSKKWSGYRSWMQQQWLLALERSTGRVMWKQPLGVGLQVPRNTSGTPVVAGNRVIISSPVSKTVWAFDRDTGHEIWSRELGAAHKGAVTIVGDELVLGDRKGQLIWLRLSTGELLGSCNAGTAFSPLAPIVVGKTLFTATDDGYVHAASYENVRRVALARGGRSSCFTEGESALNP